MAALSSICVSGIVAHFTDDDDYNRSGDEHDFRCGIPLFQRLTLMIASLACIYPLHQEGKARGSEELGTGLVRRMTVASLSSSPHRKRRPLQPHSIDPP